MPFPFDLHAMLYSDNAPDLEGALHRLFGERRLNLVNPRREFYRDVELKEIEEFVRGRGLSAQFIELPEAREYRETMAKKEQMLSGARKPVTAFSDTLFRAATASDLDYLGLRIKTRVAERLRARTAKSRSKRAIRLAHLSAVVDNHF